LDINQNLKSWMKNKIAYGLEVDKLIELNNPRIVRTGNGIMIDYWCDGNDIESEKILKISTNLNRKFKIAIESQKKL